MSVAEENGKVMQHCEGTNRLVDMVGRRVIAMLFEQGKNPIQLIKIEDWSKVLEYNHGQGRGRGLFWTRDCPEERA